MTRFRDIVIGACIGSIATATMVSLAGVSTMDPLKLSPQYYKLRFENSRVRVLEYHLKPGEKEVMHSHSARVLVALADATVKSTLADGSVSASPSIQGEVEWDDPLIHKVENIGTTEAHYLSVELKNCPN
jgi:hypothetical protein